MPIDVINRVNHMGRSQGMSSLIYENDSDDDDDSDNDGDETVHTNTPDNNDDHDSESTGVIDDDHDSENTGVVDGDECTELVTDKEAEGSLTEEQMFKDAEKLGIQQAQDDTTPSRKRVRKQNINPDFVYEALKNSTETNDVMLTQLMSAKKIEIFGDRG